MCIRSLLPRSGHRSLEGRFMYVVLSFTQGSRFVREDYVRRGKKALLNDRKKESRERGGYTGFVREERGIRKCLYSLSRYITIDGYLQLHVRSLQPRRLFFFVGCSLERQTTGRGKDGFLGHFLG